MSASNFTLANGYPKFLGKASPLVLVGFLASIFLAMSRELACCINPQPGGPGDF
jgi:hypothetical protein